MADPTTHPADEVVGGLWDGAPVRVQWWAADGTAPTLTGPDGAFALAARAAGVTRG